MTQPIDLLLEASWVVPVEPHARVLVDHAVAIDAGRIVAVLPRAEAAQRYAPRAREVFEGHALMPGLVNAHTHNPMTLMRGIADDLPLKTWLTDHIWPAEARVLGAEFVRDGIELAIAEMVRGGTTCCNENYFFPDVAAATYRRLGFRAVVGLPIIEFPGPWAATTDEYFDTGLAVHDALRGEPLLGTSFAPHAPYTVGDESFRRIRVLADQLDIPVHLHLHETAQEVDDARRDHNARPFARMQGLGIVDRSLVAVHMTQLTDAEIDACARAGVTVVHCPESNLKLASGFCPVAKLVAAGVNVALGTDGCASNNDLDMFGEMRTAALVAKAVAQDASVIDAPTALRMATLNGARALGWESRIGSLEPGKEADVVAVRLDEIETLPIYNVISQLVYACSRSQVAAVWIGGDRRLSGRDVLGLDLDAVRDKARRWAPR
ncbi:MAG TPA: TRZ/ATZ family hydrolase, partial [Candidatus Saccharimonadia bacterium]|nr:TRZ/ATZ family hydrolase [Candidatus Saccharimonadia bacterium]